MASLFRWRCPSVAGRLLIAVRLGSRLFLRSLLLLRSAGTRVLGNIGLRHLGSHLSFLLGGSSLDRIRHRLGLFHGLADRVGRGLFASRSFLCCGVCLRLTGCLGSLLLFQALGFHTTTADFTGVVEGATGLGQCRDHRIGTHFGFGLGFSNRCLLFGRLLGRLGRAGYLLHGLLCGLDGGFGGRLRLDCGLVSGCLGLRLLPCFHFGGGRLCRGLRLDLCLDLNVGHAVIALGLEGFHCALDGLLHFRGGFGQGLYYRLGRIRLGRIFHDFRSGCLDGRLADQLGGCLAFAGGNGFGGRNGNGYRQCRFSGLGGAGRFGGIVGLGGTAATVVAATLAVARATLGTLFVGAGVVIGLVKQLLAQLFLVHRGGNRLGLASRAPLLAVGFLSRGATLLLAHLGAGDGCGGGTAAAATTTAGAALGLTAAGRGSRGVRRHLGLALATLLLGLLSPFTALASVSALAALTTVAGRATLAAAAAFATGLAAGRGGRLGAGFVAAVAGEHADQGFDQGLDQARLGFLDGAVGCGNRSGCRRRCRGRASRSDALDCRLLANDGPGLADLNRLLGIGLGAHGVAGLGVEDGFLVVTQTLYLEVRGVHVRVRQHQDADFGAGLHLGQGFALLVEQEGSNGYGNVGADLGGTILQCLFFDQTQYRQGQGLDVADGAAAVTARADNTAGLTQGGTQTLARHLQQAEAGDPAYLNPGAVGFQAFADTLFHGTLVLGRGHVDEVDDDQAADVAQTQLAGNFLGGFEVGLQGSFLDVSTLGRAGRVDVDGHQGLGVVDHDGAAGGQFDLTVEGGLDLALDLEAVEQGHAVFVQLDLAGVLRHHLTDEVESLIAHGRVVDQYFTDILTQVVADGADDDVAFLIDQEGATAFTGGTLDGFPQLQQIIQVPLQFLGAAAQAGGADDHAHVGGHVQAVQCFAQLIALFALDPAGNTPGAGVVGHEYQVAAGQADEGGQGSALVAAFFLVDLDYDFLAFLENFLDVDPAFGLLGEVFAGDFLERQEAVAFGSEVDEGGFEAGLDAGDAALVDVGFLLLPCAGLDIQVVQSLAIYQRNAQLFWLSCVDQHSFHEVPLCIQWIPGTRVRHLILPLGVRCVSAWANLAHVQSSHCCCHGGSGSSICLWRYRETFFREESAGLRTGTTTKTSVNARHIILKLCIST